MTKKQSHKETKVSSDSVIQNSLEKGIQYLKDTKISNRYTIQQQIEKAINIALADQKQKIKEFWEIKYNSFILGGRYQKLHTLWWTSAMKEFEELK